MRAIRTAKEMMYGVHKRYKLHSFFLNVVYTYVGTNVKKRKALKNIRNLLLAFLILTSTGCSSDIEVVLEGIWTIDNITYLGENYSYEMGANILSFDDDGTCRIPVKRNPSKSEYNDGLADWELVKLDNDKYQILISSENSVFNLPFDLRFHRNEREKLLLMTLTSDSTTLTARKGLFNYDKNIRRIEQLEYETNK
ncbi:MAG: hypothetical protein AAGC47_13285 [Bacteroidota bacterium]